MSNMSTVRKQEADCNVYGYTWVREPDDSVRVVKAFDLRPWGYDETYYRVVPKVGPSVGQPRPEEGAEGGR